MLVKELQSLDFGGGGCLKLGVTAADEIQSPRYQCHAVDSISILNKSKKNILYHVGVCFDSCRGSTAKEKEQIHTALVVENCVAAIGLLDNLIFLFLLKTDLAVVLDSFEGLLLSQFTIQELHLHVNNACKIKRELIHQFFHAALVLQFALRVNLIFFCQGDALRMLGH